MHLLKGLYKCAGRIMRSELTLALVRKYAATWGYAIRDTKRLWIVQYKICERWFCYREVVIIKKWLLFFMIVSIECFNLIVMGFIVS